LEQLEDRTHPSVFTFAVMGDSLSTVYSGTRGSDGDQSWTELLSHLRGPEVSIYNYAANGATSSGVASTQCSSVASLVASGTVHYSVLEVGGNDEKQYASQIAAGNYSTFISEVTSHIEHALSVVQAAGSVQQVLGLIPDIAFSPYVQSQLGHDATKIARFLTATNEANQLLEAYADAHGIVIIDTVALGRLSQGASIMLAGTATSDYWSPDNFHPSGVMQGLFANAIMLGFQEGYGADTSGLQLTDQEILSAAVDAGTPRIHTPTYYNVQPLVVLPSSPRTVTASATAVDAACIAMLTPGRAVDGLGLMAASGFASG
jgi:lysophospholipase L1-like esterase